VSINKQIAKHRKINLGNVDRMVTLTIIQ